MFIVYVIIYFILVIVILTLLTIYFSFNFKLSSCETHPNFWCYDTWYCPGGATFGNSGVTGLASSIYGPNSNSAYLCGYTSPPAPVGSTCLCGWANVTGPAGTTYLQQGCDVTYIPPAS